MRLNGHDMINCARRRSHRRGPVVWFQQYVPLLFALGSFCIQLGCSRSPISSANASAPAPKWNWESFPLVDRMRLGTLSCRILPKASVTINSPFSGSLRLYVDRAQTNLPADFVWAQFEPKLLKAEKSALD